MLTIFGAISVLGSGLIIGLSKDLSKKKCKNEGFSVLSEEEEVEKTFPLAIGLKMKAEDEGNSSISDHCPEDKKRGEKPGNVLLSPNNGK